MASIALFGPGSVIKMNIAALLLQLADEGVVSVDDPIGQWIAETGQMDGTITIRQLLNHTNWLYRYQPKPEYLAAINTQPEKILTTREILGIPW